MALIIRPAQFVFSLWIALFALILVNGYGLNLVGLPANPVIIAALILIEGALLARWLLAARPRFQGDPLELAGLVLVAAESWLYFVAPAWPTLLPPSYSGDAANHQGYADALYATGFIPGGYPRGAALVTATVAHWLNWLPLRVEHLVAALWIALTVGAIYGLACTLLPDRRVNKIVALAAPFALYVPWAFFAGALVGYQYFLTQVEAQFFLIGFLWLLIEYYQSHHPVWAFGMGLCLVSIGLSFPLWLALPVGLLGLASLGEWRILGAARALRSTLLVLALPAFFGVAILVAGTRFVPSPSRLQDTGAGIHPSLDAFGGSFLLVPLLGLALSPRLRGRSEGILAFTVLAIFQVFAAVAATLWLGVASYWAGKTFYLLVFPLALWSVVPPAYFAEWAWCRINRQVLSSVAAFGAVFVLLSAALWTFRPASSFSPLKEDEVQVALWARAHLNTRHVNYIGRKSLQAHWLVEGVWNEYLPSDLFIDFPVLGPKTLEEWRDTPGWGKYALVSKHQLGLLGPAVRTLYQYGDAAIVEKVRPEPPPDPSPPLAHFGDVLALRETSTIRPMYQPGELISLTARIETGQVPRHQVAWRLQVRDAHGEPVALMRCDPFDNQFPLQRWPDGKVLEQSFALTLPPDLAPGRYELSLGLDYVSSGEALPAVMTNGETEDGIVLRSFKVPLPPMGEPELNSIVRLEMRVGESLTLLGYRPVGSTTARPGGSFQVDLLWKTDEHVAQDYTVFVHLLDATGALTAQHDSGPRGGAYPTSLWEKDEIVLDSVHVILPPRLRPGEYRIAVGMYQWPSLKRLPVTDASGHPAGEQVVLPLVVTIAGGE